jgi:coenzyme F420 hydrogenase subunit beta
MKLAYVGLPCQIEGLRKVDALSEDIEQTWSRRVSLYVGLFCRENWAYTCFKALIEDDYGVKLGEVTKFDIKKGNIVAFQRNDEKLEFPLKESKPYVRAGCQVCMDFSCELADIAVGAVGSPPKWSTIIVRTKRGAELLRSAEEGGYLEVKPIEDVKPGTGLIKRLSREKHEEALLEAKAREGAGMAVPHVHSTDKTLEDVRAEAEGKGFEELEFEIIDTGLCSACGACEAACPDYIKLMDERPRLLKECDEECNYCYLVCPRVALPSKELGRIALKDGQMEEGLGKFLGIYAARARDEKILEKGQDGGAVTALMRCALDKELVDGVISVKVGDDPWKPVPALSRSKDELMRASGTYYSYATTIPTVRRGDAD